MKTVFHRSADSASAPPLCGRARELQKLEALSAEHRLVVMVGPAGIGKTRIALQYAERMASADAAASVFFVELTSCRTRRDIVTEVAMALGASLQGLSDDERMADSVSRRLSTLEPCLLVLDNVEQVRSEATELLALWLRETVSTRILVTSRIELLMSTEQVLPISPLGKEAAIELFRYELERFHGARADAEEGLIDEIAQRVDRIPLAIILAASRTRIFGLEELRDRLERPLDVLTSARSSHRHSSVRRAVQDSLALVDGPNRQLFARLAVLRDGIRVLDAEEILATPSLPKGSILDGIDVLARASLLRIAVHKGEPSRISFLSIVREVAEELANSQVDAAPLLRRHARHFAKSDYEFSRSDIDNAILAHTTASSVAIDTGCNEHARQSVAIAVRLEPVLAAHGLAPLRVQLFSDSLKTLGHASIEQPSELVALAHLGRGVAHRELGQTQAARRDVEAALVAARSADHRGLVGAALAQRGYLQDITGDTPGARASLEEALELLQGATNVPSREWRIADAWLDLGHAHRREGALPRARSALRRAEAAYRAIERDYGLASVAYELGVVELFEGNTDQALAHLDEGLRLAHEGHLPIMEGALTNARAALMQEVGRVPEALEAHAHAARTFRSLGSRYREASAIFYLATAYLEHGDLGQAEATLEHARERMAVVDSPRYQALIASTNAVLHAMAGDIGRADEAMAKARSWLARVPDEPSLTAAVLVHELHLQVRAQRLAAKEALADAQALVEASSNDDSRFALRMLSSVVAGSARGNEHFLLVAPDGAGFQLPGAGEPVILPVGSPMRHVLTRLTVARLETPGSGISLSELVDVAWPDEKIQAEAAHNRLYVAIATLRKKGLREYLVRADGGYALSLGVAVRFGALVKAN